MSSLVRPFRALRPAPGRAAEVAAPPYDVLNTAEARARAAGRPWSFLHISKPEIDLPEGTDPYSPAVYAKGAANLADQVRAGVLVREAEPAYYAYRLKMGEHVQTGLGCVGSVAAYDANRIRRHEFTRPDKEDDRVRQITALAAQTGPVLLAWPAQARLKAILATATAGAPLDAMPALYIADGHHRSAAASRVAAAHPGGSRDWFLCVAFPHDEMRILDYNRLVRDLNGLAPEALLARIAADFRPEPVTGQARPARAGEFGMYLGGRWYRLGIRPELIPADPVASLDVSLLQDRLLGPVLGIGDPRRDPRIDFVGGIRGLGELERRVDSGEMAVAFALYPTSLAALMAVADAGAVMPPKSTWFEPKLDDGLLSHVLDDPA